MSLESHSRSMFRLHPISLKHMLAASALATTSTIALAQDDAAPTSQPSDPPIGSIAATEVDTDSYSARVARLEEALEAARVNEHIPGMAIVVIKDGEAVLQRGFGVVNMETQDAVNEDSLFAIGSSTKAFTSTLVGMFVDENRMNWDDDITEYIPYFDLNIDTDEDDAYVNLRDLLAHRTGFTRMGALWAGNAVDQETMYRTAAKAKPLAPFRASFLYNNVTYAAAGVAASVAGGDSYQHLIERRLFQPLNMDDSLFSIADARATGKLSLGYSWAPDVKKHTKETMRQLDLVDSAGAILSSAEDMGEWVRFQLGHGSIRGNRLISEASHAETWTEQMQIGPGMGYGMGWMLEEWNGEPVVHHGGNIDGFACMVAMLPESNVGFALMMNVSTTGLQNGSRALVWDILEGAVSADPAASVSDSDEDFVGEYIANFGPFENTTLTVTREDGVLYVDVPGQRVYTLAPPNDEGQRTFEEFPAAAISFERNSSGIVSMMKMYQSGLTFEVPRKGVEIVGEIPVEELQPYLGSYHMSEGNIDMEVMIQNNRLAVDVPGQMVFELHPPDDAGRWTFRATSDIEVAFDLDAQTMTMYQSGMEFVMPRVGGAPVAGDLPSVDDIMRLRDASNGISKLRRAGMMHIVSSVSLDQSGIVGTVNQYLHLDAGVESSATDLAPFGWERSVRNGDRIASASSFDDYRELEGQQLAQAQYGSMEVMIGDWRDTYKEVTVLKRGETADRSCLIVRVTPDHDLPSSKIFVDEETGDILRVEGAVIAPGLNISIPQTTVLSDYRDVGGLRIPFHVVTSNQFSGDTVAHVKSIKLHVNVDPKIFTIEALKMVDEAWQKNKEKKKAA